MRCSEKLGLNCKLSAMELHGRAIVCHACLTAACATFSCQEENCSCSGKQKLTAIIYGVAIADSEKIIACRTISNLREYESATEEIIKVLADMKLAAIETGKSRIVLKIGITRRGIYKEMPTVVTQVFPEHKFEEILSQVKKNKNES